MSSDNIGGGIFRLAATLSPVAVMYPTRRSWSISAIRREMNRVMAVTIFASLSREQRTSVQSSRNEPTYRLQPVGVELRTAP